MRRWWGCVEGGCQFAADIGALDSCTEVCQYQARADEEAVREAAKLSQGVCPHSGERLRPAELDAWGRMTRACELCDCFGFDPDDPRLSPKG